MLYIFIYIFLPQNGKPAKSSKRALEPALYRRGIKRHGGVGHRAKGELLGQEEGLGRVSRTPFQGPTLSCRLSEACWTGGGRSSSLGPPHTTGDAES